MPHSTVNPDFPTPPPNYLSTQSFAVWLLHLALRLACHNPEGHSSQKILGIHININSIRVLKVRLPQDYASCKCRAWLPTAQIFQNLIQWHCQMPESLQKQD